MRFKLGCRPPTDKPALKFKSYFRAGALPVFPPADYLPNVDWSPTMNGNDIAGNCVACMCANATHLVSKTLGDKPVVATTDEVFTFYKTQNPRFDPAGGPNGPGSDADGGMSIQTALERWTQKGITFGGQLVKAIGFARLDLNLAELRAACSLFGAICIGVQMTDAQESQWPKYAWDYKPGQLIGGHAILGGGHLDKPNDAIRFCCWAAENTMTERFIAKQLTEAWAVLLPWHVGNKTFVAGMDMVQFAKDYAAITDRPFPVMIPPVVPTPPVVGEDYAMVSGQKYRMVRV